MNDFSEFGGNVIASYGGKHKEKFDATTKLVNSGHCMMCGGKRDLDGTCCSTCSEMTRRKWEAEKARWEANKNKEYSILPTIIWFVICTGICWAFMAFI